MKTKFLFLMLSVTITMSIIVSSCSDPEGCEENPELCLATCLTDPTVCIDEVESIDSEIQIDSVEAVSKLPVRD